jgi:hypothetical protein
MRNSQNDTHDEKPPASNPQADDEAELPTGDYYYDDSTGYEAYQGDDESDEAD